MKKSIFFFAMLFMVILFGSWGFLVHRTATQLSIYQLPKKMQGFFHQHASELVKNSVRPDQRRNQDSTEAPKHYIDLEAFGDSAAWKMPMNWNDAVRIYSRDTLIKYGYAPYWIMTMKDRLTNAFRNRNKDSILFYAADIAHYIQDVNVPLHTTLNHDGQLTGQKGMHSLWESMIPEIELHHYNLYSDHDADYLKDPAASLWVAIRRAHLLLPEMFAQEKEVSKNFHDTTKYRTQTRNGRTSKSYSSSFAKAYNASLRNTINEQLLYSTDLVSDFWYTSWVDAGKPDLKSLVTVDSKKNKKSLKRENKAFKRNKLLSDSLLISRQRMQASSGD